LATAPARIYPSCGRTRDTPNKKMPHDHAVMRPCADRTSSMPGFVVLMPKMPTPTRSSASSSQQSLQEKTEAPGNLRKPPRFAVQNRSNWFGFRREAVNNANTLPRFAVGPSCCLGVASEVRRKLSGPSTVIHRAARSESLLRANAECRGFLPQSVPARKLPARLG